ncbi:MAG: hypothetical protein ACI8T1_000129 [Verrucomicrobiales bacterium]|jgi:hypothetical protein
MGHVGIDTTLTHKDTGSLWIGGSFTTLGDVPRTGLARLDASEATSYAEWIAATTSDETLRDAEGDRDMDGLTNADEFLMGSDPTKPDWPMGQLRLTATTTIHVPRNPAALDASLC